MDLDSTPLERRIIMAIGLINDKLTADEYQRMIATGIIREGAPVELIDGRMIRKDSGDGHHIRCVIVLNQILFSTVGPTRFVSPRGSIRTDAYSEPEPDFAVLRKRPSGRTPPLAEDVVLAIEVADTSLAFDLNVKAPLYARADIPEYWVADLTAQRVLRHSEPRDGRYTVIEEFTVGDQVTTLTDPPFTIAVADIFA
jgi:Uma2 family endonuclease